MDPNATVADYTAASSAFIEGKITPQEYATVTTELRQALREWRARGGFPPRGGWPKWL